MVQEHQIVQLLQVSIARLAYCEAIHNFPKEKGYLNFDTVFSVDLFYKNVSTACFHDAVLTVAALLDRDKRVISFWNWEAFVSKRQAELTKVADRFRDFGFLYVRDQIVAHPDISNRNNRFPSARITGTINEPLSRNLRIILDELVDNFVGFQKEIGHPYDLENVFGSQKFVEQAHLAIHGGVPRLTKSDVI